MGKRSFDELSVVATGVQGFERRFGKRRRHEHEDVPPISEWRCNLVRATGVRLRTSSVLHSD